MEKKLDFIWNRRSCRKYASSSGILSDEQFKLLLTAGMSAPSACHCDPWEFIVLKEREILIKTASLLPNGPFLGSCGGGIIVCGDLNKAHIGSLSYMLQDCSAAIENILLAARTLDLGSCWLGIHPREERIAGLRQLFQIPENVIPVGAIALGKVEGAFPEARNRFDAAKLHGANWNTPIEL